MPDILVAIWIVLLGIGTVAAVSRPLGAWGVASLAPIAGTVAYVVSGLVLVALGSFSASRSLLFASVIVVGGNAVWSVSTRSSIRWRTLALGGAGSVGIAAAVASIPMVRDLARFTTDSFQYLVSAGFLERTGGIGGIEPIFVMKRLFATPSIHAAAVSSGEGFSAFWGPLIAVATISTTVWLVWGLFEEIGLVRRWRLLIIGVTGVFALSTNQIVFHAFYVNGHMLFAAFALMGVGVGWVAARTGRWEMAYLSAMGFVALIPLRAEGVIVGAILLIPILSVHSVPQAVRWLYVSTFAVVGVLWYGTVLSADLGLAESDLITPVYLNLALVAALVVLVVVLQYKPLRRYLDVLPWLMIAALSVFIGVAVVVVPDLVSSTLQVMLSNILVNGRWGAFWIVTVLLMYVSLVAVFVPEQKVIIFGLVGFSLGLVIFSILRGSPYRVGFGDSGNRMLMHIVPLVLLYVMSATGVAAGRLAASTRTPTR